MSLMNENVHNSNSKGHHIKVTESKIYFKKPIKLICIEKRCITIFAVQLDGALHTPL